MDPASIHIMTLYIKRMLIEIDTHTHTHIRILIISIHFVRKTYERFVYIVDGRTFEITIGEQPSQRNE